MARSLVWAATMLGSPACLSYPGGCQASIDGIVGAGKARFLAFDAPSTSGHPIVDFFAAFEAVCRDCGYFYLDQTRNKAFALAYDALAAEVLEALARGHGIAKLDSLVCGVGTGSTLIGLGRGIKRANPEAWTVGVEPASQPKNVPPWDDLPGLRNTAVFHWDDVCGRTGLDNYLREEVIAASTCRRSVRNRAAGCWLIPESRRASEPAPSWPAARDRSPPWAGSSSLGLLGRRSTRDARV